MKKIQKYSQILYHVLSSYYYTSQLEDQFGVQHILSGSKNTSTFSIITKVKVNYKKLKIMTLWLEIIDSKSV